MRKIGRNRYYMRFGDIESIFLPPSLCTIDEFSTYNRFDIYCFAPHLKQLKFLDGFKGVLFVLPTYCDSYKTRAKRARLDISIRDMPEEYLHYYNN